MWLPETSIRRPVTTVTVMSAMLVFGWLAFVRMETDLYPEVDFPYVTVKTALVGASPEVMDQDVTDVLEEQIKSISGIKSLRSQSIEGLSLIRAEFELGKDVDIAAEEVRAKVNLAKQDLPDDVDEPIVDKLDVASQPIMEIAVSSRGSYRDLAHYADKVVKEQLQSVSGVGNIRLGGMREREVRVWLDPDKLEARGLTAMDVVMAIRGKHVELPGGRIESEELEYTVKVEGEFSTVEAMRDLVVANRNGTVVRLKDVARIDDSLEDRRSIARHSTVPSVGLDVRKQSGTNTVAVAEAVTARLEEIKRTAPEGMSIDVAYDSSHFIKASMRGVQRDIAIGVVLTGSRSSVFSQSRFL
jgi:HAE1 family hydrophobic/amphiphilic exporter-1